MKIIYKNSLLLLFAFVLMAETCAKDEKEKYVDEDESYQKAMYGTKEEIAAQEWQKCKGTASKLVSIAENNLKTLRSKIATANEYEKTQLDMAYEQHNRKLTQLKDEFDRHELIFKKPPKKVDDALFASYRSFNNFLLTELIDLNSELEEVIE